MVEDLYSVISVVVVIILYYIMLRFHSILLLIIVIDKLVVLYSDCGIMSEIDQCLCDAGEEICMK